MSHDSSRETPVETIEPTLKERTADAGLAATWQAGDPSPEEQAFSRGALVGRYVILERLGAGAMGVVYGAYDPRACPDVQDRLNYLAATRQPPSSPQSTARGDAGMPRRPAVGAEWSAQRA